MIKTGAEQVVAMQQSGAKLAAAARWASAERSEHTEVVIRDLGTLWGTLKGCWNHR